MSQKLLKKLSRYCAAALIFAMTAAPASPVRTASAWADDGTEDVLAEAEIFAEGSDPTGEGDGNPTPDTTDTGGTIGAGAAAGVTAS